MKRIDSILTIASSEILVGAFFWRDALDFGILSIKTIAIAMLAALGSMFGKWLWNKFIK